MKKANFYPMVSKLNEEIVGKVKAYGDLNLSYRKIADKCRVSLGSVHNILSEKKKESTTDMRGRPTKCSNDIIFALLKSRIANPFLSLRKRSVELEKSNEIKLSPNTIKSTLNNFGYKAHIPKRKPFLKPEHKVRRLEAARKFVGMGVEEHKKVIFTDETKINLLYNDNKPFVWCGDDQVFDDTNMLKTLKFGGGSVMIWGCFSYHGTGMIRIIDGRMDSVEYIDILANCLIPSASRMHLDEFYLAQDNDPKHTSKLTKQFLADKNITVLDWPSQSPDMNPIEPIWGVLKNKVALRNPKNIDQLKQFIIEEWETIDLTTCQNYALSFNKRCKEVIRRKGGSTKY